MGSYVNGHQKAKSKVLVEGKIHTPVGLSTASPILVYSDADPGCFNTGYSRGCNSQGSRWHRSSSSPYRRQWLSLSKEGQASALATSVHLGDSGSPQRDCESLAFPAVHHNSGCSLAVLKSAFCLRSGVRKPKGSCDFYLPCEIEKCLQDKLLKKQIPRWCSRSDCLRDKNSPTPPQSIFAFAILGLSEHVLRVKC